MNNERDMNVLFQVSEITMENTAINEAYRLSDDKDAPPTNDIPLMRKRTDLAQLPESDENDTGADETMIKGNASSTPTSKYWHRCVCVYVLSHALIIILVSLTNNILTY